jgi:predicted ATPase
MSIKEKLIIKNFFTIKDFSWDVKGFNVLTGGMGSGKSLALKLLYFCEQVFHQTVFYEKTINRDLFDKKVFYQKIEEKFNDIFISKNREADFIDTKITYKYNPDTGEQTLFEQADVCTFDLLAKWDKVTNRLQWSSEYIELRLDKWQKYFDGPNTPDLPVYVRTHIYEHILTDFSDCFPLDAMFIPASRAIAAIASDFTSRDLFINKFMDLKDFALSFDEIGDISNAIVNRILHIKNISINKKNKQPEFQLLNERIISALELSSGQQELLYLLLLIYDLSSTRFRYGKSASIFIEEPSAHLFPGEQKETIEFLAMSFNELQKTKNADPGHRFFISTHSPYVLNTINNILEKGRLLKLANKIKDTKTKNEKITKIEKLAFPILSVDDVSAYMIEDTGLVKSMINCESDDFYLYSEVIEQINQKIINDTDSLYNLNSEIKEFIQTKQVEV